MIFFPKRTMQALLDASFGDNYGAVDETRDFCRVLTETPDGRRVLARLAEQCGYLRAVIPSDAGEPATMAAYYEGQRAVFEQIARIIDRDMANAGKLKVEYERDDEHRDDGPSHFGDQ